MDYPDLIYLFDESDISPLISYRGNNFHIITKTYGDSNREKLREIIFGKLLKYFNPNSKVYFSLAGVLHQTSFPALLFDANFDFSIINSSRELCFRAKYSSYPKTQTAFLYGGINYDNNAGSLIDSTFNENRSTNIKEYVLRSGFIDLPGTQIEIEKITKILERNSFFCKNFSGKKATESTFKTISGSNPEIVHIATHAFYFPAEFSYRVNAITNIGRGQVNPIFDPLLRSGLLMAGANSTKIRDTENDGILTSQEISKIDLTNVDLAVLSACETGLGELKGFEGIFGLQRAFKLAGVNNLIISLWKVPDKQTSELMQVFYRNYMSGMPKNIALIEAQRELKGKYPNPFYWGAFTLIE